VREEARRREEEERQRAAQRERKRREKAELERAMRDEAERLEREKRDRAGARTTGSGVRGVRGTRASMRAGAAATRGVSRAGAPFSSRFSFYLFGLAERRCSAVVASASSTGVGGHTRAPSGSTGPSKFAKPSSAVSSARGTTGIPRGMSKRP
jgi:hypothetical protein